MLPIKCAQLTQSHGLENANHSCQTDLCCNMNMSVTLHSKKPGFYNFFFLAERETSRGGIERPEQATIETTQR